MKGGQILPRREEKNLHLETKARTRAPVLTRRLLPKAPLFLHGPRIYTVVKTFLVDKPLEDSNTTIFPYDVTPRIDAQIERWGEWLERIPYLPLCLAYFISLLDFLSFAFEDKWFLFKVGVVPLLCLLWVYILFLYLGCKIYPVFLIASCGWLSLWLLVRPCQIFLPPLVWRWIWLYSYYFEY